MIDAQRPPGNAGAQPPIALESPHGTSTGALSLAALAPELLAAICACLVAEDVARLAGTCRALRSACGERGVWLAQLLARFGDAPDPAGESAEPAHPRAKLARLAVCARWGLKRPLPASAGWPPSPENEGARALAQRVQALRLGASPDARKVLSYLDLNASGATPPPSVARGGFGRQRLSAAFSSGSASTTRASASSSSAATPSPASACTLSTPSGAPSTPAPPSLVGLLQQRLQRDLLELVTTTSPPPPPVSSASSHGGKGSKGAPLVAGSISAFPEQEDMLLWRATIRGLPGRPDEATSFHFSLAFGPQAQAAATSARRARALAEQASAERTARRAGRRAHLVYEDAEDEEERRAGRDAGGGGGGNSGAWEECLLPAVTILRPAVHHPNVDRHGHVCEHALRSRCRPADPVRVVLLEVQRLLDCPHFGVRPLNKAAALDWILAKEPRAAGTDAPPPAAADAGSSPPSTGLPFGSPPDLNRASPSDGAQPLWPLRQASA